MSRYFDELKRRNVFRVGAAYAVVGWLTIEVVDTLAPRMAMPEWVPGFFIILVLIGFPIALLFSWAFEMTPEGLKKTVEVDADQSITASTGQRINYVIIAALAAVVLFQQFAPDLGELASLTNSGNDAEPITIAVLPFSDLSAAGDQEYLGDGVAEEILNVLAGIEGLKVTSRTSAFAFKDQNRPIPEIAEILRVSHVVEGSIRKQNDKVRVTAQLIEVSDDSHIWSDTYDSDLSDIFRLQDEIAGHISSALSSRLRLALPSVDREIPNWDIGAYELYLRARQMVVARINYSDAIDLLDAAILIEPDFADAWAEKATALALTAFGLGLDDDTVAEAYATYDLAWVAARRATEIEPNHPLGLAVQGLIRLNQKRWIEARVFLERAISVSNPSDYAFLWLGIVLSETGDADGALARFEARLEESPSAPNLIRWQVQVLSNLGRWQQIWDGREAVSEVAMPETLRAQQVAGFKLGKISAEDLAAWIEASDSELTPHQSAFINEILLSTDIDSTGESDQSLVDTAERDNVAGLFLAVLSPEFASQYFLRSLDLIRERPTQLLLQDLWTGDAVNIRKSPEFDQVVRDVGLPAYWDLYGWPPACRRTGIDNFECE